MQPGDIVTRPAYNNDLFFRITRISDDGILDLSCISFRLSVVVKSADELKRADLSQVSALKRSFRSEINQRVAKIAEKRRAELFKLGDVAMRPGRVLHIDSDSEYVKLCLDYYKKLSIPAEAVTITESAQPDRIEPLLREHMPDILIITGHDSLSKKTGQESYKTSPYFVKSVKNARFFQPSRDGLIVIAGACQSNYEALIEAGANVTERRLSVSL